MPADQFALINTIFAQESAEAAHQQWRVVTDQLRERYGLSDQIKGVVYIRNTLEVSDLVKDFLGQIDNILQA